MKKINSDNLTLTEANQKMIAQMVPQPCSDTALFSHTDALNLLDEAGDLKGSLKKAEAVYSEIYRHFCAPDENPPDITQMYSQLSTLVHILCDYLFEARQQSERIEALAVRCLSSHRPTRSVPPEDQPLPEYVQEWIDDFSEERQFTPEQKTRFIIDLYRFSQLPEDRQRAILYPVA